MIINELVRPGKIKESAPIRMVCPYINAAPKDEVLQFSTVVDAMSIFGQVKSNVILMFDTEHLGLLNMWNLNQDVLDMSIMAIMDVPGADYNPEYLGAITRASQMSYHTLIGDLAETTRRAAVLKDSKATGCDREQARVTRKDGSIKDLDNDDFDIAD